MTSLEYMNPAIVDELISTLHVPDELTQPATWALEDVDPDGLMGEMETLLNWTDPMMLPASDAGSSQSVGKYKKPQQQQKSSDAVRCSMYRKKRKLEKETLQREIYDLSGRLDQLRERSTNRLQNVNINATRKSPLWRALATQEKEKRQAAEEEQVQLRAAISSWASAIEDLRSFLRSGVSDEVAATKDDCGDVTRHCKKRFRSLNSYTACL